MDSSKLPHYDLRFNNLSVTINKQQILKDSSGLAIPGEMLAIMAPSGENKISINT